MTWTETLATLAATVVLSSFAALIGALGVADRRGPNVPDDAPIDNDLCLRCGEPCLGISAKYCDACMGVPAIFRD